MSLFSSALPNLHPTYLRITRIKITHLVVFQVNHSLIVILTIVVQYFNTTHVYIIDL